MSDDTDVPKRGIWRDLTLGSLLVTAVGVLAPIAWDWYKNSSELTLQEISSTSIVNRVQIPNGLTLAYGGVSVENLTKLAFVLSNTGSNPVQASQVLEPPRITFKAPTRILSVQIDRVAPGGVRALSTVGPDKDWLEIGFPLLNAHDRVEFSVLLDQSLPTYTSSARMVGIRELTVSKVSPPRLRFRGVSWTVYVVALTTIFSLGVLIAGIHGWGAEQWAYRLWKDGWIVPTQSASVEALRKSLDRLFTGLKIPAETAAVYALVNQLPNAEPVSADNMQRVRSELGKILENCKTTTLMLAIFLALFLIGAIYVGYSVYAAIG
jgi:hypothetical protein